MIRIITLITFMQRSNFRYFPVRCLEKHLQSESAITGAASLANQQEMLSSPEALLIDRPLSSLYIV